MVLNACFIDFSNLLVEIPKMTKPELINVAETLTKRLKDSTLELERLNEAMTSCKITAMLPHHTPDLDTD